MTSRRYSIGGLDFFFKSNQSETAGGIKIYYDAKPYPYLMAIMPKIKNGLSSSLDELTTKATNWCIEHHSEIIKKLKELDTYIKVDEEEWRKNL